MGTGDMKQDTSSIKSTLFFECYYFLLVSGLCVAMLFLGPLVRLIQTQTLSPYRNDLGVVLLVTAPITLWFLIRFLTKKVLPGRIFLIMLGTGIVLEIFYAPLQATFPVLPEELKRRDNSLVWTKLFWPTFIFGFAFIVSQVNRWKKNRLVKRLRNRRPIMDIDKETVSQDVGQMALLRAYARLKPRLYQRKGLLEIVEPTTALGRWLKQIFAFGVVFLFCVAFHWAIPKMVFSDNFGEVFFSFLMIFISPIVLHLIWIYTLGRPRPLFLSGACCLSMLILYFVMPSTQGLLLLGIPAVAFFVAYCLGLKNAAPRQRRNIEPGQDPAQDDPTLNQRLLNKKQVARRTWSKRSNSHPYSHPYYKLKP